MNLKSTETAVNLMRAFAGESQARNRYTFAAAEARKNNLYVIEWIFNYTAGQEKEHAEIFYNHLKELNGESIRIDGAYPVEAYSNVATLLRCAQHNEYEEHDPVYSDFAKIAEKEGFPVIAASFSKIAEIEKVHGDRFGRFADAMEQDKLFKSEVETKWMCLNCGHIHNGTSAPGKCPVCQHEQGYFIKSAYSPFEN